jgi:hypothetical protein
MRRMENLLTEAGREQWAAAPSFDEHGVALLSYLPGNLVAHAECHYISFDCQHAELPATVEELEMLWDQEEEEEEP